jgi:hypothetical protein
MNEYKYRLQIAQSDFACGNLTTDAVRLILENYVTIIDDVVTTNEDTPLTGNVLTNDSGSGTPALPLTVTTFTVGGQTYNAGDTATIAGVGTIVINADGSFTFTPVANYNGQVPAITYTAEDANGGSNSADLSITVTAVNDAPEASPNTNTVDEDTVATGNVLSNDTDVDGDPLILDVEELASLEDIKQHCYNCRYVDYFKCSILANTPVYENDSCCKFEYKLKNNV